MLIRLQMARTPLMASNSRWYVGEWLEKGTVRVNEVINADAENLLTFELLLIIDQQVYVTPKLLRVD